MIQTVCSRNWSRVALGRQKTYRMPTRDIDLKRNWWQKVRCKLSCALERNDPLLAGFLASTSAAEIVFGLGGCRCGAAAPHILSAESGEKAIETWLGTYPGAVPPYRRARRFT